MNSEHQTQMVIRTLAAEAGLAEAVFRKGRSFEGLLLAASILTFIAAAMLARLLQTAPRELVETLVYPPFDYKIVAMTTLGFGAFMAVRQMGQPALSGRLWLWLLPGLCLLIAGAALDGSGFPVLGRDAFAVPICTVSIVVLSLPPLVFLLRVLSKATVTRPTLAGAAAGLLAGAIGGAAYAFVCRNDGPSFVALWYGAAILVTALIGAAAGSGFLKWS